MKRFAFFGHRGKILTIIFFLMMLIIVLLCAFSSFFSHVIECENVFKPEIALPNILSGLIGVALIVLLWIVANRCCSSAKAGSGRLIFLIISLLLCVLQILFIWNYYIETNWDVGVLVEVARDAVAGKDINVHEWYFSENPNNLLLLRIFIWVFSIAHWLGIGQSDVFLMLVLQCLLVWLSGAMLFQLLCKLHNRKMAWVGYFLYFSLVTISPWVSIPYSDTMALVFPLAMLWLAFTSVCKRLNMRLLLICLVAVVGYKIKPQTILVLVSLIAVYGFKYWRLRKKAINKVCRRKRRNTIIAVSTGLILGVVVCVVGIKSIGMKTRNEPAFGMPHYLMMGMNTKSIGSYAGEDVDFSRTYPKKIQRAKANFEETGRRLQQMGLGGFFQHIGEKTLINFYDGTFGWGWEGNFYKNILPKKNETLSPFLRDVYYTTWPRGKYYKYWSNYAQIVWMGVLILSLFAAFGKIGRRQRAIMLALILFTVFEALFEARARYIFCFSPLFVITVVQGLQLLLDVFSKKRMIKKC